VLGVDPGVGVLLEEWEVCLGHVSARQKYGLLTISKTVFTYMHVLGRGSGRADQRMFVIPDVIDGRLIRASITYLR
jgi:hypothetical protein